MTKIHIFKICALLPIVAGFVFILRGSNSMLPAQIAGQGSMVYSESQEEIVGDIAHEAAQKEAIMYGGRDLLIGIVLILVGFGLHAMVVVMNDKQKTPRRSGVVEWVSVRWR